MTRAADDQLDERWVRALRNPVDRPEADDDTWSAIRDRASVPVPAHRSSRRSVALLTAAAVVTAIVTGGLALAWRDRQAGDDEQVRAERPTTPAPGEEWERLPPVPLSGQRGVGVWSGQEMFLVGGGFSCPGRGNCSGPDSPPLSDGAALDPAAGRWRIVAPAPVAFSDASTAVIGDDIYFLTSAGSAGPPAFLRYSIGADHWIELPLPVARETVTWYRLFAAGDRAVALRTSEEAGPKPDLVFDAQAGRWDELPAAPLPRRFDRSAVWSEPHLYTFSEARVDLGSEEPWTLVARLDPATGSWERLPSSDLTGYGPWLADDSLLVDPDLGGGGDSLGHDYSHGGIFDIDAERWDELPAPPTRVDADEPDPAVAGAIGSSRAVFVRPGGLLFDTVRRQWIEMPSLPGPRDDERTVMTAGTDALVVGGVRRTVGGSQHELLDDVWIWRSGRSG